MAEFREILAAHLSRYPQMRGRDCAKLAYQAEFGPGHMVNGEAEPRLLEEWRQAQSAPARGAEDIGGGLRRFYLDEKYEAERAAPLLARLFALTAEEKRGSREGLERKLADIEALLPDEGGFLREYRAQGCPALGHSGEYRSAYAPHYRVVEADFANYFPALLRLWELPRPALVAIDGRCGSGKTRLAACIARVFDCNVLHMDDFYLPLSQREPGWDARPCGNMDLSRFEKEVMEPAERGAQIVYRPFDCRSGSLGTQRRLPPRPLTVAEGSYSQHPRFAGKYDLKIFLTCDKTEQERRLRLREGDYYPNFEQRWMPLEEQYFKEFEIQRRADLIVDATAFAG